MRTLRILSAAALLSILCSGIRTPIQQANAGPVKRPNVLFILTDDQRADQIRQMPTLKRELMAKGVSFSNAIVPTSFCCPSRTSFLTGNHSHTTGVWRNTPPDGGFSAFEDSATIATALRSSGYRTGLFGKYLNGYKDPAYIAPGWDEWFALLPGRAFAYESIRASRNGEEVFRDVYSTVGTYRAANRFISETPLDTPFFAMWTPIAPHGPTIPEERYERLFSSSPFHPPPSFDEADARDKPTWIRRLPRLSGKTRRSIDHHRKEMLRTLRSVDDGLGLLLRTLAESGRLRDTIVVFASDNGYMLGEHRVTRGKALPYAPSTEIPFVVRYDRVTRQAPRTNATLVGNIDLAPTLAALTGLALPSPVDGIDLTPTLRGDRATGRRMIVMERAQGGRLPGYCGTRTKTKLYVSYSAGTGLISEYYDYVRDPYELENRIDTTDPRERKAVARLHAFAVEHCNPTPPGFAWE